MHCTQGSGGANDILHNRGQEAFYGCVTACIAHRDQRAQRTFCALRLPGRQAAKRLWQGSS
eukprot:1160498-Pelagomonas_calceolata.AAC.13